MGSSISASGYIHGGIERICTLTVTAASFTEPMGRKNPTVHRQMNR